MFHEKSFDENEKMDFKNKFFKLIEEFPNAKWEIIRAKSINDNQHKIDMKLYGSKTLNGKKVEKWRWIYL